MKIEKVLCKLKCKKDGLFFIKRCIGKKEVLSFDRGASFSYMDKNSNEVFVNIKKDGLKFFEKKRLSHRKNSVPVYSDNLLIMKVLTDYLYDQYKVEAIISNKPSKNYNVFMLINRRTGNTIYKK